MVRGAERWVCCVSAAPLELHTRTPQSRGHSAWCSCCGVVQDFSNRLGSDGTPLWLSQSQIRGWFSRKAAALKRAALERALEQIEVGGEEEDDDGQ